MKQNHNMKKGDSKIFKTFGELHVFAETYKHDASEFRFNYPASGSMVMVKL